MKNQWFRMYSEAVDDEKLRLLAFEDRWHFIAILCCKSAGLLDAGDSIELLHRKLSVKLGVQLRELEAIADRLAEVGLIDAETFQPLAWDVRQFQSDSSTERSRKCRERKRQENQSSRVDATECNNVQRCRDVAATPPETDTDTETDISPSLRSGEKRTRKRADDAATKPDDVSDEIWRDWLTLRRAKRAPVTATVLKGARQEAAKAGMPLEAFLEIWCQRGSQGLKAEWLQADQNPATTRTHGNRHANRSELDPIPFHHLSLADQCAARNRARRAERERAAIDAESFQRFA